MPTKCLFTNCDKYCTYGKKGSKKKEYCKVHAPSDYVNVTNKRCIHPNCETRPNYGYPGYSAEYCNTHKLPRMCLNPLKKQKEEDKLCVCCSTVIHYNEHYCSGCKRYLELGKTVKRHEKELRIKTLLEESEIKFSSHDKTVEGGCSKKRPDFVIPTPWGHIVIEVDEFQHYRKTYTCECEITRMKQIYYDIGEQNLLFVRYNPDSYEALSGMQVDRLQREEYLVKFIKEKMEYGIEGLGVVYLYYDGYSQDLLDIDMLEYK